MAKSDMIQLRVDPQVKREAEALFEELGIPMATAINLFLKTAIRAGGIPFPIMAGSDFGRDKESRKEAEPFMEEEDGQGETEEMTERELRKREKKEKAAKEKRAKEQMMAEKAPMQKTVKEKKTREEKRRDKAQKAESQA